MSAKKTKEERDLESKSNEFVTRLKALRDSEGKIHLTPALAEEIIAYNIDNYRQSSPGAVLNFYHSMVNGTFVAQPIDHIGLQVGKYKVEHGPHMGKIIFLLLLNGQNRILACIKAGIAIDIYLTFCDVEEGQKSIPYTDTGTARTAAQFLARECNLPMSIATPAAIISKLMCRHLRYAGLKPRSSKILASEVHQEFTKEGNYGAILAAVDITLGANKRKGLSKLLGINAGYKTALAKGLKIFPRKRMEAFHSQFCMGQCLDPKTDKSAELLSKYYAVHFANYRGGGEKPTQDYYERCEWAVRAFGDKEYVTEIGSADKAGDYLPL